MATLDPNKAPVVQLRSPEGDKIFPAASTEAFYDKDGNKVPLLMTYKVDGTELTAPELTAAYDLAKLGGSNRNLLDNWDFRNPVNQRGNTTATAGAFLIDRWKLYASGTATTSSDGIIFQSVIDFGTQIELSRVPLNVPVTFSVITNLGAGSVTHSFSGATNETVFVNIGNGIVVNAIYNWDELGSFLFCLQGINVTVKSVKLELGTVSTLINDPPADYGEELRKCQRYYTQLNIGAYSRICIGNANSDANPCYIIDLPCEMRVTPTFTCTGVDTMGFVSNGVTASTVSLNFLGSSGLNRYTLYSTHNATQLGNTGFLVTGASPATLCFSADL